VPGDGGSFDVDFSNGLPFQDDFGGGEDTSNLPELPTTGVAVGVMAGISLAMIAGGAAIGARRRARA
jgi:LPXTG-motif cell wall-anchored protein